MHKSATVSQPKQYIPDLFHLLALDKKVITRMIYPQRLQSNNHCHRIAHLIQ